VPFLRAAPTHNDERQGAAVHAPPSASTPLGAALRRDFPILDQQVNGKPLVYLDNAATSQKPVQARARAPRELSPFVSPAARCRRLIAVRCPLPAAAASSACQPQRPLVRELAKLRSGARGPASLLPPPPHRSPSPLAALRTATQNTHTRQTPQNRRSWRRWRITTGATTPTCTAACTR
jgi:hypothetical protein